MSNILFVDITIEVTIGIDLGSFHVRQNQPFKGIVNIPHIKNDSMHVIHFQHGSTTENDNGGLRYGYWFSQGNYYIKYNETEELYEMFQEIDNDKYNLNMQEYLNRNMVSEYPRIDEENNWGTVTDEVNWSLVNKIVDNGTLKEQKHIKYVDSSMTTLEENEVLQKKLNRGSTETKSNNLPHENVFRYTRIQFKSNKAIRSTHRMEDYNDKSYYLNNIIIRDDMKGQISQLVGELEFSFINSIIFGNYGSSLQWHNIIELLFRSSKVNTNIINKIDEIVSRQLTILPSGYKDILINETLWQAFFQGSFQGSFQMANVPRIRQKLIENHIIEENNTQKMVDDQEQDEQEEYIDEAENNNTYYHNIDSSDDDEDGPTIVGGIYYNKG
ncbi:hypothetical protein C6P45_004049 [Maudiozyma exigua]|uniref:A1 cistron-splicing factor AAR2 n=1 Tax=Maudiozyma exigua TaxID=34358 RepID=A0A9P6WD69_MAUEX|nr:hypothetical protein C6P45_004049 [Kazachstania exigua]